MAVNVYTRSKISLNISVLAADWTWIETWPGDKLGVPIHSIHFVATGAADACVIRDGSITGPVIFHRIATAVGDQVPSYFGGNLIQLAIDFSEGIYTALSRIIIVLDKVRG